MTMRQLNGLRLRSCSFDTARHPRTSLALGYSIVLAGMSGLLNCDIAAAQSESENLDVTVQTIRPDLLRGELLALSTDSGAVLKAGSGEVQRIPTADLVRITSEVPVFSRRAHDFTVTLANGDTVLGRVVGGSEEAFIIETLDLGTLQVPLDAVVELQTANASAPMYRDYVAWFRRQLSDVSRKEYDDPGPSFPVDRTGPGSRMAPDVASPEMGRNDQVLLTNGDIAKGFITSLSDEGVVIEGELGESVIPYRLALIARFASVAAPTLAGHPHLIIQLRSSGRMTATDLKWSGNSIEACLRYVDEVHIEADRIVSVDVVGGRWEWLSDREPVSYEHTPMLSLPWAFRLNRNVLGRPITVGGEKFEHGIGVHSRSVLTYDLKGAYREFVTQFGIDDDSGPLADVSVVILVDGQRRYGQEHVQRGQFFGPIRLDTGKAKYMELVVDFGTNGSIQDRFDWINPALIR
ncbi:MAG: NPCBM/NEW2 domain-containing protein [Planctomycetes bacterium]|nr:NPCBM/NEW2 domain-containing protein [Planctomycetota bacterium]